MSTFAFGFNLVCALLYGIMTIRLGVETPAYAGWFGGVHAALAFSVAAVFLADREG
jgi:hypothetical protein